MVIPKHQRELSVSSRRVPLGSVMIPETFTAHLFGFDDNGPNIDITWQVVAGSPVCREVRITAVDTDHEVKVSGLAGVRIEDLLEQTTRDLLWTGDFGDGPQWPSGDEQRAAVRQVRQARAGRKVKLTDELLREVAEVYRANLEHEPTQAVGEHFDKQPRTARLYVQRARERTDPQTGKTFLGKAIQGKAGEQ